MNYFARWKERRRNRKISDEITKKQLLEARAVVLKEHCVKNIASLKEVGMTPIQWIGTDDKNEVATIYVIFNSELLCVKVGPRGGMTIAKI